MSFFRRLGNAAIGLCVAGATGYAYRIGDAIATDAIKKAKEKKKKKAEEKREKEDK